MKSNRACTVLLLLDAIAFVAFAVQWFFTTERMASALGIVLTNADALTDAQAVYGGLELGSAVFLTVCALRPRLQVVGLLAATSLLGGLWFCRSLGIALAPTAVTSATWNLWATDLLGVVINGGALVWARRRSGGEGL